MERGREEWQIAKFLNRSRMVASERIPVAPLERAPE